jgi:hypothetical protein
MCAFAVGDFFSSRERFRGVFFSLVVGVHSKHCATYRKGIRLIFLNWDEDIFVATQLNFETSAKALGRVLFSF